MPVLIVSLTYDRVEEYLRLRPRMLSPTEFFFVTRAHQLRRYPDSEVVVLDGAEALLDWGAIAKELCDRAVTIE